MQLTAGSTRETSISNQPQKKPVKIVIHWIGYLGDAVVAMPILRHLAYHYQAAEIVLFVPTNSNLFPLHCLVPRLRSATIVKYNKWPSFSLIGSILKNIYGAEMVVAVHQGKKTLWQKVFAGIFWRTLACKNICGLSDSDPIARMQSDSVAHESARMVSRMICSGIDVPRELSGYIKHELGIEFPRDGRPNSPYVVIGIGSKRNSTRWPLKNYLQLIQWLNKRRIVVVLVGDANDYDLADLVFCNMCEYINLCGATSLLETCGLIDGALCYIGNDSGGIHLASLTSTNIIGIYSARTQLGQWHPISDRSIVLEKRPECSGCFVDNCNLQNKCLRMIKPQEVIDCLEKLIQKPL